MYNLEIVKAVDPEIASAIGQEIKRQDNHVELIASENFTSKAVMAAMGSPLTNKYAEGYPGKRYYGGCDKVDIAEQFAIDRAKELFGADHANVQPHSGAQANMAVYYAMLKPGDTIMGMHLAHGGHLTHGSHVSISGTYYKAVGYGVDPKTELLDYDEMRKIAKECRPKMIVAGASAYSRILDFKLIREIADEVEALVCVDMAHIAGLVAAGYHPSPVPHAQFVTTTTHKTLRGPRGGLIVCPEEYAAAVDKAVFPGIQGGPLMHTIAAKAVSFKEALSDDFKTYIGQVVANAKALAEALMGHGFRIVSGGTDNHLMLVDLQNMDITGKLAEKRLDAVGITCNKNAIPYDPKSPFITSGIRLGTPAMTTRGLKEAEMRELADIIAMVIKDYANNKQKARKLVSDIMSRFPMDMIYG